MRPFPGHSAQDEIHFVPKRKSYISAKCTSYYTNILEQIRHRKFLYHQLNKYGHNLKGWKFNIGSKNLYFWKIHLVWSNKNWWPIRPGLQYTPTASLLRDKTPLPSDAKQSGSEPPVWQELWEMRSIPSLPSLPSPLWSEVVAPDRVKYN